MEGNYIGFSHYWYKQKEVAPEKFDAIVADFSKLVIALDDMGVKLAGGRGDGLPEINSERVRFNGSSSCGHPKNGRVVIPWPSKGATGVMDPKAVGVDGNWFAGSTLDTRMCDGDCAYETFAFYRVLPDKGYPYSTDEERPDLLFDCCKTAYRPYDVAVTAFLIVAKKHLGDDIKVSSDGEDEQWYDAKRLCYINLGYGPEFSVKEGELVKRDLSGTCACGAAMTDGTCSDPDCRYNVPGDAGNAVA